MNYNNIHFIIVSNNDDISWVDSLNIINKTIYNMGYPIDKFDNIEIPPSFTYTYAYLYHIIKNYDNIENDLIFCNSNAFKNNNFNILNKFLKKKKKKKIWYKKKKKTEYIFKYNTIDYNFDIDYSYKGLLHSKNITKSNFSFKEWFEIYICKYPDNSFIYVDPNIIRVNNNTIKKKTKQYYIDIFNNIFNFKEELFFFDKSFFYLFNN